MTQIPTLRALALATLACSLLLSGCGGSGGSGGGAPTGSGAPVLGTPTTGDPTTGTPTPGNPPTATPSTTPIVLAPIQDSSQGGSPSAAFSLAVAVNDANQVIGFAETAAGSELKAALWGVTASGATSAAPLSLKPLGTNAFSAAFGIDGSGNAVGQSADGTALVAVIWKIGVAEPERLPALATGAASAAFGISPDGSLIVGEAQDATFQTRAVIWQVNGGVVGAATVLSETLLPPATAGSYASANGVSDSGWIAGVVEDNEGQEHAALWRPDGVGGFTLTDLRRGSEAGSEAIAVNLSGQVVGLSEPTSGTQVPALWDDNGQGAFVRTDLAADGGAVAINDSGRIAGWEGAAPLATVWNGTTQVNLLTTPSKVYGLNNSGLVVGAKGETGFVIQSN